MRAMIVPLVLVVTPKRRVRRAVAPSFVSRINYRGTRNSSRTDDSRTPSANAHRAFAAMRTTNAPLTWFA